MIADEVVAVKDVKAVLCDLDGTLLYSLEDLADSVNVILAAHGFPQHPTQDYRIFVGDGVETMVRRALPGGGVDDVRLSEMVAQVRGEYEQRWNNKSKPYPGVPDMLDALRGAGLHIALLTNKPHEFTMRIMETIFAEWPFDHVAGAKPDVPLKPDPAAALTAAETLGLKPSEMAYIGDSDTDMKTATAAGMLPIGVLWGYRSAEELKANGTRFLIAEPMELLRYIL